MARKPAKSQQTVVVKDYGEDTVNRLAVILKALEQMDERSRLATLGYIKATYPKEWPSDSYQ
ncbi:hypothetical protein [Bradyrhizobium sp.]|uniref:hypothetical protein n=1 Tax=Bradyrhizobium sp. TaxID=376 RepID=UPI002D3EB6BC|nr:hypothetical protein [Bradyrhizobium sp.]HZR77356.1 hypothetical protein [Bradyrhizobium sp.]